MKVNYILKKEPISFLPVFRRRRCLVISFREADEEGEHIKLLHEKKKLKLVQKLKYLPSSCLVLTKLFVAMF
jgi:hypothetical protein